MNLAQLVLLATFNLARNWRDTVKLNTVNDWIKEYGNPKDYGRGYAGGKLASDAGSAFAELRKDNTSDGVQVSVSVFMGPSASAFAAKTWSARKMDSKLEKMFGRNNRIRISI